MTDPAETEAKSVRAADGLVQAIETSIAQGQLPAGAALPPERDLMAEFGVSRTVVREAVRILSSRGLIDARPRYRPVVRAPGVESAFAAVEGIVGQLLRQPQGVKNLFDTRIMIEAGLVREAAQHASTVDLQALRTALAANESAIPDSEAFYRTDTAFHAVLYDLPKNPVLPAIHQAYATWLAPQWSQMPRSPERNALNFAAHAAIVDAILMRDPDAAETVLRAHLAGAWAQVRQTFGED